MIARASNLPLHYLVVHSCEESVYYRRRIEREKFLLLALEHKRREFRITSRMPQNWSGSAYQTYTHVY